MSSFLIRPIEHCDGRVSIQVCRRKTGNHEADMAPIPLDHGVLEIELDVYTAGELFKVLARYVLAKIKAMT